MDIKNLVLPYYLAIKMKEIGFREPCLGYWDLWISNALEKREMFRVGLCEGDLDNAVPAPTWVQTFIWLNERFKLSETGNNVNIGFLSITDTVMLENLLKNIFDTVGFVKVNDHQSTHI